MPGPPVLTVVERLPQVESNREAIAILESFLADARAGRLIAVAVAGVLDSRVAQTGSSSCSDPLLLLGAVTRLSSRINFEVEALEAIADGPPPGGA
jgi:hypothetical protein